MIVRTARPVARASRPARPPAGEATRRFLAEADRPPAVPRPWTAKATGAFKRYADAERLNLPDDRGDAPLGSGPFVGHLLRHLLGIGRCGWAYDLLVPGARPGPVVVAPQRPVPSEGELYPIEAYVAGGSRGFPDGLHHYDRAHHALQRLRPGDHRAALLEALTAPPAEPPDLVIVLTAVFWRSGVKYGDFAYKLQCQETGALVAQSLALTEDLDVSVRPYLDFDGALVEALLALTRGAEGALAVLCLTGSGAREPAATAPGASELIARRAAKAIDPPPSVTASLPLLTALHAAATIPGGGPGSGGNPEPARAGPPPDDDPAVRLPEPVPVRLRAGVAHRRSAPAGFAPAPIPAEVFAGILAAAAGGRPGERDSTSEGPATCGVWALALRVDGVRPGGYRYDPEGRLVGAAVPWRGLDEIAAKVWPSTALALREAAAVILPVGDPLGGVATSGDLWYRLQLTESGAVVHRAALAAAALGLASRIHSDVCCGPTDSALGLRPGHRSLSALLVGVTPRRTPVRFVPGRYRPD
ncbi:SagB/ThcOx family dehydrogenase [Thermopolyspora sp. NPDC052614]|uniref:SagB/ThcOx family dehydrogenase n=1 Tax=Thermopolyspora sp. NPDC052614 TaxID=3155682 RepID=UPI0034462C27